MIDSILYTRAGIKRREASEEIEFFVDYWLQVKGIVDETLVFDSKLTGYGILHELDRDYSTTTYSPRRLLAPRLASVRFFLFHVYVRFLCWAPNFIFIRVCIIL